MASTKTQIKNELAKALFIDEKNKKLLLETIDRIPTFALQILLKEIRNHNSYVNAYVKIAIKADPKLAGEFKKKTQLIKVKIHKIKELEESLSSEKNLKDLLDKA